MNGLRRLGPRRAAAALGVLVAPRDGEPPFAAAGFLRRLSARARPLRLDVLVFALDWIDWERRRVRGYRYCEAERAWKPIEAPLPRLVYDRMFCRTREEAARRRAGLARLMAEPGVALLGRGVGGKLDVWQRLAAHPEFSGVLPRTERYRGPASLARWLRLHGTAVLKPQGGMQGRGVARIRQLGRPALNRYEARGRTYANRVYTRQFAALSPLLRWVEDRLVRGRRFLIQEYLTLHTDGGEPFDIRALVQKDGEGRWSFTGAAARVGPAGGMTSNLHGGGEPREAFALLAEQFGGTEAERILALIRRTALSAASVLEESCGPLLELGIDFGVDRHGRVWLLEVNSKPGRASFVRLNDPQAKAASVASPLRYARYVLDRRLGGQNL